MATFEYSKWDDQNPFRPQSTDEIFDELSEYVLNYGSDVLESLHQWQVEHPDVVDQLVKQGLVEKDHTGNFRITPKGIKRIENKALESIFNVNKKGKLGRHETEHRGSGQTMMDESKPYQYGDPVANLDMHGTLKNALHRQGQGSPVHISEDDLQVFDTDYQTSCATVVLIDMSGSMMRYGKYGSAKRVAMALQAMVRSKYQSDFLQFVGFYTYASPLTERELINSAPKEVSIFDPRVLMRVSLEKPPEFVPQHFTNIHAGLQYARRILSRQAAANRQLIVITDGEPTAHIEGREIVLDYPPSEKTARITLAEAKRCANDGINVSSFALIENDLYFGLVNFVEQMAKVTSGISATCNAHDMGNIVINSFVQGRQKRQRL